MTLLLKSVPSELLIPPNTNQKYYLATPYTQFPCFLRYHPLLKRSFSPLAVEYNPSTTAIKSSTAKTTKA